MRLNWQKIILLLICLCFNQVALGQNVPSIADKAKANLEEKMPATKIIEVLGLPDNIKPYLDMTVYYYNGVEIHCYNKDIDNTLESSSPDAKIIRLSDINKQTIAWLKFKSEDTSIAKITGKTVKLGEDAALYYMYKRSQAKKDPDNRQYYLSSNGRIYYRDENKTVVWVLPPRKPVQIPIEETNQYPDLKQYRGYNGKKIGKTFGRLKG